LHADANAFTTWSIDREQKVVADIIAGFRDIVLDGADRVDSTASTGQAACNSMSIGIRINGLVKAPSPLFLLYSQESVPHHGAPPKKQANNVLSTD